MNAAFQWSPLLPPVAIALIAALAGGIVIIARLKRAPDFYWRGLFLLVLGGLLMNPVVINEVRQPLADKLLVVVDESASQTIAKRNETAEKILAYIQDTVKTMPGV